MARKWRLIKDGKCDGYYNMACDEALFLSYQESRVPTFRMYEWSEPFFSIGYHQNRKALDGDQSIPFVRRITGGAAILHDSELTYSLVCSLGDLNLSKGVRQSYRQLCIFLIEFYSQLGIKAEFACENSSIELSNYKDWCFSSLEHFDLVAGGKKIGGNAQCRKKDIIFQHGSIPLAQIFAEISDIADLKNKLAKSFANSFMVDFKRSDLDQTTHALCTKLIDKYKSKQWSRRCENRFGLIRK
ncbi:MAG: lipoate--protein ligase family protein [Candidatus Omnitrophica bacterium]|nr:lipoate--protein ligase family protein [Candidatus Omnitrophota bacterium]